QRRHLNGLELSYRTLVGRFGFEPGDIQVLSHDKSLRSEDEPPNCVALPTWPGDGTPYQMRVTGEGSRAGFREALASVGSRMGPEDLLFLNITGHGGNHGDGRGPYLLSHPRYIHYKLDEICADIATVPPHRSLLVLMSQCFAGGFSGPLLAASPAQRTF